MKSTCQRECSSRGLPIDEKRTGIQQLVLIIGRDGDQEFRGPIIVGRAERPSIGWREIIRVHGRSRISHVPNRIQDQVNKYVIRGREFTYVNSDVLVAAHLGSTAFRIAVGTTYSVTKLPLVSLTLRVTPRLMVWRRRQAPSVDEDTADPGLDGTP